MFRRRTKILLGLWVLALHSHPAVSWAATSATSDLAASDVRAIFPDGPSGTPTAKQNAWSASSGTWFTYPTTDNTTMLAQLSARLASVGYTASPAAKEVGFVVHRTNPRFKEEAVLLQTTHNRYGAGGHFYVQSLFIRSDRTGGAWTLQGLGLNVSGAPTNEGTALLDYVPAGDIGYERKTGRLIWVHGLVGQPDNPMYWVWQYDLTPATSGFAKNFQPVYSSAQGGNAVIWVRLVTDPVTDDAILAWSDNSGTQAGKLFTAKWDWAATRFDTSPGPVESSLSRGYQGNASAGGPRTYRPFDVAIEASGRALIAYGNTVNGPGETGSLSTLRYRTLMVRSSSTWSPEQNLHRILDTAKFAGPSTVVLAAEPGGNRIAAGVYLMDSAIYPLVYAAVWDGNAAGGAGAWVKNIAPPSDTSITMDTGYTAADVDLALIDSHAREEAPIGTYPVAVAWLQTPGVTPVQTWGILTYGGEITGAGGVGAGLPWALFAPTGTNANKWVRQTSEGTSSNEIIGVQMQVLPDKWHLMHIATRYVSSTNTQEVVAMQLTNTVNGPINGPGTGWVNPTTLTSNISFLASADIKHQFFPAGFGVNLGFPQLNSVLTAAPDPTTQYFGVNASMTAVQPIHILDRAGLITKNAGLALFIPATMAMEWGAPLCPATKQVKVSGNAVARLSTIPNVPAGTPSVSPVPPSGSSIGAGATTVPVCAVADAQVTSDSLLRVLRIGVFSDFVPGDELYLGGLDGGTALTDPTNKSLVVQGGRNLSGPLPFSKISPVAKLGLDVTGDVGNGGIDVLDDMPMRIAERLEISNAAGGQATNAFVSPNLPTAPAGTNLLTFSLTARGGDLTLRSIKLSLSAITGTLSTADLSAPTLTGATSVSVPDASSIVFNFAPMTLIKDAPSTFTFAAGVASLASPDGMQLNLTLGLSPNHIVVDATPAGTDTPSLDGKGLVALTTFTPKLHKVAKYDVVTATPAALRAGDPLTVNWDSATNSNPPTIYEYSSVGPAGPWTAFTGTGTCTSAAVGTCASTAPTAQAMTAAYVKLTGTSQTPNDFLYGTSVAPFKVSEFLTASDPGQPANALNTITAPVAQAPLLAVGLKANGATVTLKRLAFTVTPSAGLAVSNYRLVKGGTTVAGPQATADFTLSLALPNDGTTATYQLQADVDGVPAGANLPPGGTVAVSLPLTNAVIVGQGNVTSDNPLTIKTTPAGLTQVSKTHTVTTYTVTAPGTVNVSAPWTIAWQSFGSASPTNVKVEYKTHAIGWTNLTAACTLTAGQCVTTVPDQATTQAQVRITDNTTPSITGSSALFNIATVLSGLTLDGGGTWVVGRAQQVQWTQTGSSATTQVELSLNNGTSYTVPIATQTVSGPFPATKTAPFQATAAQATATAKVRVQDGDPNHPTTKVESTAFPVDFAFKNIQPAGNAVLLGSPPPITWTTLGGLTIASVKIHGIRADGSTAFTIGPVSNSGSRTWTPPGLEDQFHIRICDATAATVCADGQPFNIVSLNVSTDKANYTLGDTMRITWSGADAIANLKVWFKPDDGSPMTDLLGGSTVPGASQQFDWTIPVTLNVPKAGVVRIEDAGNAITFGESASLTLHGALAISAPTAASRWLINTPQTISWDSKGNAAVKIEWATTAAGPFLLATGTPTVAAVPGTNNFAWTPLAAAKSPTAVVRISDANDPTVFVVSPAFHVIGQLTVTQPAGGNFDILTTPSLTIQWAVPQGPISTLRLRVLDSGNNVIFQDGAVPNPPAQYTWSSVTTGQNLTAEICDASDLTVCASSPFFTVSGLKVDAPAAGQTFTLGAGGVTVPIQWRPVGGSGAANVFYQIAGGPLQAISSGVTSTESATNTFNWNVPVNFATLSNQVQIVIRDVGGTPTGTSAAFALNGAFAFTAPPAGTYSVTDPITINWNTIGQITEVNLGWSTDGCATQAPIPTGANTANGNTSVSWTIPLVAVSNNLQFCLADAMAGHAPTTAISAPIIVGAKLAFATPVGGELWPSRGQRDITWTTQGSVGQVKLEYSLDNFATANPVAQLANAGTFAWTVPDLKTLVADPQQTPTVSIKLRISDATPGHPPVPQVSNALSIIYYKVAWNVRSATPPNPLLSALGVDDTSGWNVSDFSLNGQTTQYYPYGTFSTIWSVKDVGGVVSQGADENWLSDRDQARTVLIELLSAEAVVWKVNAEYHYQTGADPDSAADDSVEIDSWLERTGKLVDNSDSLIEYGKVEIFEDGTLIRTLPAITAPVQLPDNAGLFKFLWDLKREDGSSVPDGVTYFTKTTIRRNGRDFTSGGALNVTIPKKILTDSGSGGGSSGGGAGVGLTQQQLDDLNTTIGTVSGGLAVGQASIFQAVNDIRGATVGADSALSKVQNELTGTGGAGTPTVRDLVTQTNVEVTGLNPDGTKAIDSLKQRVITIQSDPDAGLPKLLQNQNLMKEQLTAQRRGKILNRETAVEPDDRITIQYLPGVPNAAVSIQLLGPAPFVPVGPLPMSDSNGDGILEFVQDFGDGDSDPLTTLPLGEYTVLVQEAAAVDGSGNPLSNNMMDSLTLSLRTAVATAQDIQPFTDQYTEIADELGRLDTFLTTYQPVFASLQELATATSGRAQQLVDDLAALSKDWQANSSAESLYVRMKKMEDALGADALIADAKTLYEVTSAAETAAGNAAGAAGAAAVAAGAAETAANTAAGAAGTAAAAAGAAETAANNAAGAAGAAASAAGDVRTALGTDALVLAGETLYDVADDARSSAASAASAAGSAAAAAGAAETAANTAAGAAGTAATAAGAAETAATTAAGAAGAADQKAGELKIAMGAEALIAAGKTLNDLRVDFDTLEGVNGMTMDTVRQRFIDIENLINGLPAAQTVDQTAQLEALTNEVTALGTELAALGNPAQNNQLQEVLTQMLALQQQVGAVQEASESTTLMEQLAKIQEAVEAAQGSSAATGFAQSAFNSASEAVTILKQLQAELQANGAGSGQGQVLLGQLGDKLGSISSSVTVIPGKFEAEDVSKQLRELAEKTKGVATEKGYQFDSLYELSETQATDVKTMRNQVEEMKQLLEIQRAILEKNVNQPVMKTWFEAN